VKTRMAAVTIRSRISCSCAALTRGILGLQREQLFPKPYGHFAAGATSVPFDKENEHSLLSAR
jgi:hypothetical protein